MPPRSKTHRIQIYTKRELYERVARQAEERRLTISEYLNALLEDRDAECTCPEGWGGCKAHGYVGGRK